MKKTIFAALLMLLVLFSASAQTDRAERNYVLGFYNLENLFDIYDDPAKNDAEFLPETS